MKPSYVVALLAFVGLAFAQGLTPIGYQSTRIVGQVPADRWVYVLISGSTAPYVVPPDKHLVVTTIYRPSYPEIMVNGQIVTGSLFAVDVVWSGTDTRVSFPPGTVLTAGPGDAHLWGYLEPAR